MTAFPGCLELSKHGGAETMCPPGAARSLVQRVLPRRPASTARTDFVLHKFFCFPLKIQNEQEKLHYQLLF